jgi:hypothetical protein
MLRALAGYGLRLSAALGLLLVLAAPQRATPWLLDPRAAHPAPRPARPAGDPAQKQDSQKSKPSGPAGLLLPDVVEPRPAGAESRAVCRLSVLSAHPVATAQRDSGPEPTAPPAVAATWRDLQGAFDVPVAPLPAVRAVAPRAVALLSTITLRGPPRV